MIMTTRDGKTHLEPDLSFKPLAAPPSAPAVPNPPLLDDAGSQHAGDTRTENGSTRDHCSRWPAGLDGEGHAIEYVKPAGTRLSIRRCSFCGWIDGEDLAQQAEAIRAEAAEKTRRQIREERERNPPLIAYDFPLRPGLVVRLVLPLALTGEDAARLVGFVQTLPLDTEVTSGKDETP